MTKDKLRSEFEDSFDANSHASEGGMGPDVTDWRGMWRSFEKSIDEYTKQQLIEYSEWLRKENWEGKNHIGWINHTHQQDFLGNRAFYTDENIVSQFLEQQNK